MKIKPKKPSFKLIKKQMRELLMNQRQLQAVPSPQASPEAVTPPEPISVNAFDDFTNVTTFLKNLLGSIKLPEHVTAPRTKQLFDDVSVFLQTRLNQEIEQKY